MNNTDRAMHRLSAAGYRLTNARRTVVAVLCESEGHLTSAEVLARVQSRDASIGRASVFRTLELLTELAVVRPTYLEARTPHYVVMPTDGHHAHIVCVQCSRVIELVDCHVEGQLAEIAARHGVSLTGHLLELYGMCEACAARE